MDNCLLFPLRSRLTRPDAELKVLLLYAASKWILTLEPYPP
ncbi:hypothetical protein E1A91_D07G038700v1 [Gossypium mustelinum]|uniref:Uncharacterized protein n=1 Tax=Gossypium mustelinum TaxID=34275 RepID=A0A5D2U3K9_GOSMU|nr:hypothetical protein E1A91_D07G038700v1 [Gossypium mustelinum]